MDKNLAYLKIHNLDFFIAILLSKRAYRQALAALLAFYQEIYDIPQSISDPMVGKVKFEWWREVLQEVIDGKPPRPHPILQGLDGSNVDYKLLLKIIDEYEKLLEGWQPKTFTELTDFLNKTLVKIIEIAAKIAEQEFKHDIALAYSYIFIARKIKANNENFGKLASNPDEIILKLKSSTEELLPKEKSVFGEIAKFYSKNLNKKNIEKGRWKLLLKFLFSKRIPLI